MFARLSLAVVVLASTALAQPEPSRLRFPTPARWTTGSEGNTLLPPGGDVALTLAPSTPFAGTAEQWADACWNNLPKNVKLLSGPIPGTQGRFLTRTGVFQQADGTRLWLVIHTLVQDGHGEDAVYFATDQTKFRKHLPALSKMVAAVTIAPATAHVATTPAGAASAQTPATANPDTRPPAAPGARLMLADYEFTPPEGWLVQKQSDQILLTQTPDQSGCLIQILAPQPSSGDLEKDASAVFDMMYSGWQPQRNGADRYTLSRGFLPQGLPYRLLEAAMARTNAAGQYETEDGAAFVIGLGEQIAIVAVRHRSLLAHIDCLHKYTTWRRFFNSFTARGAALPSDDGPAPAERLIGRWTMTESGASGEYLFAANGNYAFAGALGSSYTTTDFRYEYLHLKTYAFDGDGRYTLAGRELALTRRSSGEINRIAIRFEQVNHGGAGWVDRLYLHTQDSHGENEVSYEKGDRP